MTIRAICDAAGKAKGDSWQGYASAAAAEFTKRFLLDRPFAPKRVGAMRSSTNVATRAADQIRSEVFPAVAGTPSSSKESTHDQLSVPAHDASSLPEQKVRTATSSRTKFPVDPDLESFAESIVSRFVDGLVDRDEILASRIAETNASGYYLDELEFIDLGPLDLESVRIPFCVRAHFAGEQHEDRFVYGNSISSKISGVLEFDGSSWDITDYEFIEAEIEHDDDPPEDEEHETPQGD